MSDRNSKKKVMGCCEPDEPTNRERSLRIDGVMKAYQLSLGSLGNEGESLGDRLASMLADCMHWCDHHNVDFAAALNLSTVHHMAERNK